MYICEPHFTITSYMWKFWTNFHRKITWLMLERKSLFYIQLFFHDRLSFNFPRKIQSTILYSISHWFLIPIIWKTFFQRLKTFTLWSFFRTRGLRPFLAMNWALCYIARYRFGWQFSFSTFWALQLLPNIQIINDRARRKGLKLCRGGCGQVSQGSAGVTIPGGF